MGGAFELVEHPEGGVLPVRAQPDATANAVRGEQGGARKQASTQTAQKCKANQALIVVLAEARDVKRSQIELLAGETQRAKKFLIRGVTRDELSERIASALGH